MPDGMSGWDTTFSISGAAYNAKSISLSGFTVESIDITSMSSSNMFRQFVPGLKDGGEVSVEVVYDEAQMDLVEAKWDGDNEPASESWSVTFPDGSNFGGSGFLTGFSLDNPMDDVITASITMKVNGALTFTSA
jgi:predicted secreted protein